MMLAPVTRLSLPRLFLLASLALAGCRKEPPGPTPDQRADGLYVQGTAQFLANDYAKALESFNQVKALRPNDPRLPAAMGEAHLALKDLNAARDDFQAATKLDPKRGTNWSRLGYLQAQLGQKAEARESLEKALALNPKDYDALEERGELEARMDQLDKAVEDLLAAAKAGPKEDMARLYLRAVELLKKRQRDDDALALLQRAVDAGVHSPEVLGQLGDAQVRKGKLEEAGETYREAAKVSPKDPGPWEMVGEIEMQRGKLPSAVEAYRESLRIADRGIVHVDLARVYLKKKDKAAALKEVDLALAKEDGDDEHDTRELADVLAAVGRPKDAFKLYEELANEPDNRGDSALQKRAAELAKLAGDKKAAKELCSRVTPPCK